MLGQQVRPFISHCDRGELVKISGRILLVRFLILSIPHHTGWADISQVQNSRVGNKNITIIWGPGLLLEINFSPDGVMNFSPVSGELDVYSCRENDVNNDDGEKHGSCGGLPIRCLTAPSLNPIGCLSLTTLHYIWLVYHKPMNNTKKQNEYAGGRVL